MVGGGSSARTAGSSSFSVAAPRSEGPHSTLRHGSAARRVVIAPTIARDAQTERLECVFDAEAHRGVRQTRLWINLPPLTIFAHPPVGCGHRDTSLQHNTPRNAMSGRDTVACCRERVPQAQHALPPHLNSYTHTIAKQHPYLRCRLTGADGGMTGLELTTWRAGGGSHGRAGAAKTRLKMNGGPAMTINLRR